ncbi:MAG: PAS domain S-box protein [Bacteroidota bacterium]
MNLRMTGMKSLWMRWGAWIEGAGAGILTLMLIRASGLSEMARGMEHSRLEGLFFAVVVALLVTSYRRSKNIESVMSDRDKALQAFRGSQDMYRHIVENAHEMIFEVDMLGRVTFVNKAGEQFMEYSATEILGRKYTDFVLDSHRDTIHRSLVIQAARNITLQYMEGPTRTKSGKIIWFGHHVHLKRDGDNVTGFEVISRDVTDRRAAEEQLQKSARTIRTIFDQAPIGMTLVDNMGRFLETNQVIADMLGYTREELRGKRFSEVTHNDDIMKTAAGFRDLLEGREDQYQIEKRYIRKDGTEFWGRLAVSRLEEKEMDPAFAIGMIENIDARRKVEESNRQLQSIVEGTTDLVATGDPNGRLLYMNKAGRMLLGIGATENITGISPREFYSEEMIHELKSAVRGAIVSNGRWQGNVILKSRSGREIPVSQVILGHLNQDGELTYFSTIARDITKEEEAKTALDKESTLLRTIIESIPDEVAVKDTERRFVLANTAVVRALKKKSASEVLGLRDEDLMSPEFAGLAIEQEERLLRTGEMAINIHGADKMDPVTGTVLRGILMTKVPLRNKEGMITNIVVVNRDITELREAEAEKKRVIEELKNALTEVKTLSGLLPICAGCKKIRDDGGYWNRIESYIETHTSVQFSHGLCPDCMGDYFPGAVKSKNTAGEKNPLAEKEAQQ